MSNDLDVALGLMGSISTADIIADSILLAAPLELLQSLRDKRLRRRLIFIFSTCIVTTIVSLIHAVYIFKHEGPKVLIVAFVEVNYHNS